MWDNGMWMIWSILIVALPLVGLLVWEWWRNRQIDKHNEQQDEQKV